MKIDLQTVLTAVLALGAAISMHVDRAQAKFKVFYAIDALRSDSTNPTRTLTRSAHVLYDVTKSTPQARQR